MKVMTFAAPVFYPCMRTLGESMVRAFPAQIEAESFLTWYERSFPQGQWKRLPSDEPLVHLGTRQLISKMISETTPDALVFVASTRYFIDMRMQHYQNLRRAGLPMLLVELTRNSDPHLVPAAGHMHHTIAEGQNARDASLKTAVDRFVNEYL